MVAVVFVTDLVVLTVSGIHLVTWEASIIMKVQLPYATQTNDM